MEPNFDKYPLGKGQNENKVTFQDFQDGEQSMNCPICGFECTHITGVEVFARGEDAADTCIQQLIWKKCQLKLRT